MDAAMTALGMLGAGAVVLMYALIQQGRISPQAPVYYAINGAGAAAILISLAWDFDAADLGGIVLEVCWIFISAMGILRGVRQGKKE